MLTLESFSSPDSTPLISSPLVVSVPFSFSDFSSNSLHFPFKLPSKPQNEAEEKCLEQCQPPCSVFEPCTRRRHLEEAASFPSHSSPCPQWGGGLATAGGDTDPWGTASPLALQGSFFSPNLAHKLMRVHWVKPEFQLLCKVSRTKEKEGKSPTPPLSGFALYAKAVCAALLSTAALLLSLT